MAFCDKTGLAKVLYNIIWCLSFLNIISLNLSISYKRFNKTEISKSYLILFSAKLYKNNFLDRLPISIVIYRLMMIYNTPQNRNIRPAKQL